jgi:hypothetical protein
MLHYVLATATECIFVVSDVCVLRMSHSPNSLASISHALHVQSSAKLKVVEVVVILVTLMCRQMSS